MRKNIFALIFVLFASLLVAQQSMNNDSVIKLCKAGLSDDLIVNTVNASSGNYNTSPEGLIGLKEAGVSEKVISALQLKASSSTPSSTIAIAPLPSAAKAPELPSQLPPARSGQSTGMPRIFIRADENFGVALTAALNKKHAPATVVLDERTADYVLQSAAVAAKQESGASKIARCLFAYCIGIEGSSSVSVQLVRVTDGSVVWAYQVRKANGGPVGIQSLSEAVAKHLKNEFLDSRK